MKVGLLRLIQLGLQLDYQSSVGLYAEPGIQSSSFPTLALGIGQILQCASNRR